jgi:amino acid permease
MNVVNTIIGGGILGFPFIMSNLGVFLAIFVFYWIYYLSKLSCKFLYLSFKELGICDYTEITKEFFKKPGQVIARLSIFSNCIGACSCYVVIYLDAMKMLCVEGFALEEGSF